MPQAIRDIITHSRHAMILAAAAEHGVFDAIGPRGATAEEVRGKLRLDARASEILLNALAALEVLRKKGNRYINAPIARRHLRGDSPHSILASLRHTNMLYKTWSRLDEILRTGRAAGLSAWEAEDAARQTAIFTRSMYNNGFEAAAALPEMADLGGRRTLIDIGGGPGHFAYNLCLRHPGLEATVYDLPVTIRETRKYLRMYGMGKRMRAVAGDYNREELPRGYDAALVSHIIHSMGERENRRLLKKVFRCLNPGGMLLLRDFLLYEDKTSPPNAAVFAVNMLVNTPDGRTYTFKEVTRWLRDTGFYKIRRAGPPAFGDASLLTALRPPA